MQAKIKNLAVSMLVGTALVGSVHPATLNALTVADSYNTNQFAEVASGKEETPKNLEVSEPTALDLWIEKLAHLESNNREKIRILDVNNKYSYGCLQFQEWTFRSYGQKYGLVAPGTHIEDVIYDCTLQKQIAKKMIEEKYSLWQSWYTSVVLKDLGLPPRS